MNKKDGPKVLILDIETSPILAWVWGLFDQNISLNQIKQNSFILSWSAKWLGDNKVMYMDQRKNGKPTKNDPKLIKGIWKLLDEADIVVGQNVKRFDLKKLNTAFIKLGLHKPSSYKVIDTLTIAKSNFAFESNKLEFTTGLLNEKYTKLKHNKFPGQELWNQCLDGNQEAWKEMELYNKHDVFSTEEYYNKIAAWDNSAVNFNIYHDAYHHVCNCGSYDLKKYGYAFTTTGKYQRFKCKACGRESRDSKNIFTKEKRDSLKRKV